MQVSVLTEPIDRFLTAWAPQPGPQSEAISADFCQELAYGGSRGGGKSDFLLGDYLQSVPEYGKHWHGILIRQTMPELDEIIARSREIFPTVGAIWAEQKKTWTFPEGGSLKMRSLERLDDFHKYKGHSYGWIGFDEGTHWADLAPWHIMRACLRWGAADIPTKRMRMTCNPGGKGHSAIKAYFVDPAPLGFKLIKDKETGIERMFIPARITDNKILLQNDPDYIDRLKGLGSPALVKMWLDGDWNQVAGAYFSSFTDKSIVRPFALPPHLMRFCSFDWGSASPFCVLWFAVADGFYNALNERFFPPGALIVYREWYGGTIQQGVPRGLKLKNEEIARGILAREDKNEDIAYRVADPSIFAEEGGPCIAEVMNRAGVQFMPGDNKRIPGWQQMQDRFTGQDGRPMLYFFDTCTACIRTIPAVPHDEKNPEDIDTDSEDHAADSCRYGCMSRMWTKDRPKPEQHAGITYADLMKQHKANSGKRRHI